MTPETILTHSRAIVNASQKEFRTIALGASLNPSPPVLEMTSVFASSQ
jgi:hypothetical protein